MEDKANTKTAARFTKFFILVLPRLGTLGG
jgi:hypothetical protein